MGYETKYSLKILGIDDYTISFHEKEISKHSMYQNCFIDYIKWDDHEKDMRKYSKKEPEMVFCLIGYGEDENDVWKKYFHNGKMQECKPKITWPKYNFKKLK